MVENKLNKILRIGTRASTLAKWQANKVLVELQEKVANSSISTPCLELVTIASEGDQDRATELNNFPSPGVFTKALDQALLAHKIDIAVHSLKDLPTILLPGIKLACVLERDAHEDILVYNHRHKNKEAHNFHLATGSVRRKSQWLHRYPTHQVTTLRGNVQTRLEKLYSSSWDGIILSKAGIDRLAIGDLNFEVLDWLTPAPAQGVIAVTMREEDAWIAQFLDLINHSPTAYAVKQERDFLQALGSGCSMPLGALAKENADNWLFQGIVVLGAVLLNIRKSGLGNLGLEAACDLKKQFPGIDTILQK